jgi:hypothetical protein
MDNLSSHKSSRIRELIESRGCELMYLPPYSPDLNPIEEAFEEAFAKLKVLLRKAGKAGARTREALLEAMSRALAMRSHRAMPGVSLSIAATDHWPNRYDKRSMDPQG